MIAESHKNIHKGMGFNTAMKRFFYGVLAIFIYALLVNSLLIIPTLHDKTTTIDQRSTHPADTLAEQIAQYVTTPKNGVPWNLFAKTKPIDYLYINTEGDQQTGVRPEFSEDLKKLDGQEIVIQGYMFPLESSETQSLFLLEPFPMTCPFQKDVGMEMIIDVQAAEKITAQWDPITLKGKLQLIPRDDKYNFFYRLKEARLIK